jgi:hypothetical protein
VPSIGLPIRTSKRCGTATNDPCAISLDLNHSGCVNLSRSAAAAKAGCTPQGEAGCATWRRGAFGPSSGLEKREQSCVRSCRWALPRDGGPLSGRGRCDTPRRGHESTPDAHDHSADLRVRRERDIDQDFRFAKSAQCPEAFSRAHRDSTHPLRHALASHYRSVHRVTFPYMQMLLAAFCAFELRRSLC